MRTPGLSKALALVVVLAAACSGSKGPAVDAGCAVPLPTHPMDPLLACQALANAVAARENDCGRLVSGDIGTFVEAQCPAAFIGPREAAFDAGTFAYDERAVGDALNSLMNLACNQGPSPVITNLFATGENDEQLAWGNACLGFPCDDLLSCGPGLFCQRLELDQPCGVCATNPGTVGTVDAGELCGNASDGFLCTNGACNGEACVNVVAEGQKCENAEALCAPGLVCGNIGECVATSDSDGGCQQDSQCEDGLTCTFGGRCYPAVPDGGDCGYQGCGDWELCAEFDGGAGDGGYDTCEAFDPVHGGGRCWPNAAGAPTCPEFESCRDGGCFQLSLLGGSCGVNADCALGACLGGTCQLEDAGAPCGSDAQCAAGRCDTQGSFTCGPLCN